MFHYRFAVLAGVLLCSCAPESITGPRDVLVVDYLGGSIDFIRGDLSGSIVPLENDHFTVRSGGTLEIRVFVDDDEMPPESVASDLGNVFNPRLTEDSTGLLVPVDSAALFGVSVMYHLERARGFLGQVPAAKFGPEPKNVFIRSNFLTTGVREGGGEVDLENIRDNAAYLTTLDSIIFVDAFRSVSGAPVAINPAIVVHEYSHAVFQATAGQVPFTPVLRAVNEGFADLLAAAVVGRTNPLVDTFDADISSDRELDATVPYSAGLISSNPYPLGTAIASVFWGFARKLEQRGMNEGQANLKAVQLAFQMVSELRSMPVDVFVSPVSFMTNVASLLSTSDQVIFLDLMRESGWPIPEVEPQE